MGHIKFLSREKLIEYLDEELRNTLNDQGIYEVAQYGWLGDGEQDPEYRGHAVWQDHPSELPKLSALGEEFINLMRSARYTLGLSLLYQDTTNNLFSDNAGGFGIYFTDTANKLNLATDRVREFLITAFVRQAPWGLPSWTAAGQVIRGEGFYENFLQPFHRIMHEVETWAEGGNPLNDCMVKLQPLAAKVAGYRSEHQDPARHLSFFQDRLATVAANMALGYSDDAFSDTLPSPDQHLLEGLREWYQMLIETSNLIFLAEHLLRGLPREAGTVGRQSPRQQFI